MHALGDVRGRDVLELGCGAAQWSIALAGDAARAVGLDVSIGQLRHARANGDVPLVLGSAEAVPLRDASFDVVFCDHGAMSFCPPERTVAECARLLRPGGRLVFCKTTALVYLTWDATRERQTRTLRVPYFGIGRFAFDEGTVDHQVPYGEWIRLFRRNGLVVEDLIELQAPAGATTTYVDFVPRAWARKWPAEEIWVVRKS
ncbi:MAG TPA: class I SAM-dependent methyltransferase [Acidimicrobiia bacterium]|nr:class I SAM-dependent methyltransferase [Acidimicrobiia bacterium]